MAPEVDPSEVIDDEAEFQALSGIDWSSPTFQEVEKLKTSFEVERNAWAEEKTASTQRAEKAEAALQEATTELTGLKRHVSQMVSAIFGKSPH